MALNQYALAKLGYTGDGDIPGATDMNQANAVYNSLMSQDPSGGALFRYLFPQFTNASQGMTFNPQGVENYANSFYTGDYHTQPTATFDHVKEFMNPGSQDPARLSMLEQNIRNSNQYEGPRDGGFFSDIAPVLGVMAGPLALGLGGSMLGLNDISGSWLDSLKNFISPNSISVSEGAMPTNVGGWYGEAPNLDPNGIWSGNYIGPAETTISEMAGGSPSLGSVAAQSWYPGSLESGNGGWSMPNIGLNEILRMAGPIASLAGGAMGSGAARSAADTQSQAGRDAIATQMAMYGQTRADLEPYRLAGNQALGQLQGLTNGPNSPLLKPFGMEDFYKSPAYEFNLSEGMRALNHGAAARQQYYAPATLKSLGDFAQGRASNEFQNAFSNYQTNMGNIWNRLSSLSGMGQNAAANMGSLGANVASNVGNNITGIGNANAAGQVGAANALSGGMSNAYNAYLMDQILSKNQSSLYGK